MVQSRRWGNKKTHCLPVKYFSNHTYNRAGIVHVQTHMYILARYMKKWRNIFCVCVCVALIRSRWLKYDRLLLILHFGECIIFTSIIWWIVVLPRTFIECVSGTHTQVCAVLVNTINRWILLCSSIIDGAFTFTSVYRLCS